MPKVYLDAIDQRILSALQLNGRLSNVDLAAKVGLSPSPCLRRVRFLEEMGLISGYRATLERENIGLGLTVFVGIKVERHDDGVATNFQSAIQNLPEVTSCYLVSGESDYLLEIVVPDLAGYQKFLTDTLLKLPNVRDIRSNFAIQKIKAASPLPLDHLRDWDSDHQR